MNVKLEKEMAAFSKLFGTSRSLPFSDNEAYENTPQYLQRVLPPAQAIRRENYIHINSEQLSELVSVQLNPENPEFTDKLDDFIHLMEKIRSTVQFNLGLSRIERESHESDHPIWVKKGKPDFPIGNNGEIEPENILYDSIDLNRRSSPKVLIVKDDSSTSNEGFSILYQTKFRSFSLHIAPDGRILSSLHLNWPTIYDDLSPDLQGSQHALRSFTPWQRHSESNFFNGRSTDKILRYLASSLPHIFTYDSKSYFRDMPSESLVLNQANADRVNTSNPNLYLTLDSSLIKPAKEFIDSPHYQPILAVVRRKLPLLGDLIQLAPAMYRDGRLHLILHGHQYETEIQEVFSCDFENEQIHTWPWQEKHVMIQPEEAQDEITPIWKNLHLLKNRGRNELTQYTSAAPMVRGSDPVLRKYWLSSFDIATVYSEMITIADIFNMCDDDAQTPQSILEELYYSDSATASFRRLQCSEYELMQADHFAFQVVVPHESPNESFFWGDDGEHISRTARMAIKIMFKMVPENYHNKIRFAVNMCCPAAAIEKIGGGFGLINKSEYLEGIIHSIKREYPNLHIEFKTLMLSNESDFHNEERASAISPLEPKVNNNSANPHKISFEKNKFLSEMLQGMGANGLVWQGKPRNEEVYDWQTVLNITKASMVKDNFKFGYSGMVATLEDSQLLALGYNEVGNPHYSVEHILNSVKEMNNGVIPDGFEVMLGRVLLGSSWLLLGHYASDQEILLMTFLQSFMLREYSVGAGQCGIDLMQIQLLYNVRHISDDALRNKLMAEIFEARSANTMIDALHAEYSLLNMEKDRDAESLLKPSIVALKTAIASASGLSLFSEREKNIADNQLVKFNYGP